MPASRRCGLTGLATGLATGPATGLVALLLLGGCAAQTGPQAAAPRADSSRHPAATARPVIAPVAAPMAAPLSGGLLAALPQESPPVETAAPEETVVMSFTGLASWYGKRFHGRRTASGERYDMAAFTAAHQNLPFGSRVRVTNLANGHSVVVTINDRGPYVKSRVIDLSRAAARHLGIIEDGVAEVRLDVLDDTGS